MSVHVIASYDGTANENDSLALARLLGQAGAEVSIAYVRHAQEPDSDREALAQSEAETLLDRGAELLGIPGAAKHVVTGRSTPEGLAALAEQTGADVIVFCSDSHTARGHIGIGNSAERLLDGGRTAVAIAPAGLAESSGAVRRIVAIGDAGGGAEATAQSLAHALGATVAPVVNEEADLLVLDSRPTVGEGRVSLSSSATHLIEIANCAVLAVPRGRTLAFDGAPVGATAA